MPLVTCPACTEMTPMQAVNRNGIEIDICTRCRGVWLDRGELDKLLAAVRAAEADEPRFAQPYPSESYGERGEAGERGYHDPRTGKRKRGFDLFDIFD